MSVSDYLKSKGFKGFKSGCSGCVFKKKKLTFEKWVFNRLLRVSSPDWNSWEKTTFNYKLTNKKFSNEAEFEKWYNGL